MRTPDNWQFYFPMGGRYYQRMSPKNSKRNSLRKTAGEPKICANGLRTKNDSDLRTYS